MKALKIGFIMLFSLLAGSSFAQWVQLPYGGPYFSSAGNKLYGGPGVHVSTDNGNTWTDLGLQSNIQMVVQNGSNLYAGSGSYGIYLSTNNGQNWASINNGIPSVYWTIYALCTYGNHVFAGTDGGIYHSTDNGANWTTTNTGLINQHVKAILQKDNFLFAGTLGGLSFSTNNGMSWSESDSGVPSFYYYTGRLATNGVNIYRTSSGRGILVSTNNGAYWSLINNGLPIYDIYGLTVSGNNLFEGQFRENGLIFKVYYSSNNGQNWLDVTGGIYGGWLHSLTASGGYLFASCDFGWRRSISEITGVTTLNTKVPSGFSLYQNYPNPFNPGTNIKIDIPSGVNGKVYLVVYNELGKEAATLIDGEYKPGTYEVEWDASNYPSGVYFYKLITNGFTDTKKMVLMK